MGRHSEGDERVFWRSVGLFILKWVLVAALPLLALWGVVRLVSQPEEVRTEEPPDAVVTSPAPETTPEPSPVESVPPTTPPPTPTQAAKGTLQILNGTNKEGLAQTVADRLEKEGYSIKVVARASKTYEKTTVFYQPDSKSLADQVARFLGTNEVKPAPDNLDRDIPVTIVVGTDYKA